MNSFFFVVAFSFLCGSLAQADILFIDLNNAVHEIEAARSAAMARNEKLIVIPPAEGSLKGGEVIRQKDLDKAEADFKNNSCGTKVSSGDAQCKAIQKRIKSMSSKLKMSAKNLKKEIKKIKDSGVKISSMVISGHDGNGKFSGTRGQLSSQDFIKVSEENPGVFQDMRGLMLWGCYTTTPGSIEGFWKKSFPNVELMAGYDGRAPLASTASSWLFLEDILTKEQALAQIKDKNELAEQFRKLKEVNNVHGSLCNGDLFVSNKEASTISEYKLRCNTLDRRKWDKELSCYREAKEGCENTPKDLAKGPLRVIYEDLQEYSVCEEPGNYTATSMPNPNMVLLLLHFEHVKANFLRNHAGELNQLNGLLEKLGAPASLQLKGLEKLSRKDLLAKIDAADNFLQKLPKDDDLTTNKLEVRLHAQKLLYGTSAVLKDTDPTCAPFDWVEPNNKKSSCMKYDAKEEAEMAEYHRSFSVRVQVEQKIQNIIEADKAWQDLKQEIKAPVNSENVDQPLSEEVKKKTAAVGTEIYERNKKEIQAAMQEERKKLANQKPVFQGGFISRSMVIDQYETGTSTKEYIQSVVSMKISPVATTTPP